MTSSLVGSEMCIRDRILIPTVHSCLRSEPPGVPARDCCKGSSGGLTLKAVSYTHLTLPTICSV
eukprot:1731944-Prorocentrum_lima.AAC.1